MSNKQLQYQYNTNFKNLIKTHILAHPILEDVISNCKY